MRWSRNSALGLLVGLILLVGGFLWAVAAPLWAQSGAAQGASASSPAAVSSSSTEGRVAKLEQDIAEARSSGDNGWMLVSSALVLMMTGPGLALFYGGLVRRKNVLATMMQSFALMAVITVLWALFGYSLCFGEGSRFLGGVGPPLFRRGRAPPPAPHAPPIPPLHLLASQFMV